MPDNKPELRRKYRATQALSTPANLLSNAQALINDSNHLKIALYHAIEGEPNLQPLILQNPRTSFCLPKITDAGMAFAPYKYGDELQSNHRYPLIFEPESEEVVMPDIMFVPAIAFDIKGNRLGRGRGFYDKYIALYPNIITIGVTFQEKLLEFLPQEAHDCRMHYIITEYLIMRS